MGKCYIVQVPKRRDERTGEMVPIFDLRKVREFGEPEVCLPSGRISFAPGPMVDLLRDKLRGFCDEDHIVAIGDPTAMFCAAMVAGEMNTGRVKCLKWDKESRTYISVQIDVHHRTRKGRT